MRCFVYKLLFFCFIFSNITFGQLSYERSITQHLCSPELKGRGYVEGGDSLAAEYIAAEFKKLGIEPYSNSYFQNFSFEVNTFPDTLIVKINGKKLNAGSNFVVNPASGGGKYTAKVRRVTIEELFNTKLSSSTLDSCEKGWLIPALTLYETTNKDTLKMIRGISRELASEAFPVILLQRKKFTWSVAQNQYVYPLIVMQDSVFQNGTVELNIHAKFIYHHNARNVIAYLPATKKSKQTIVFTAHYDHLGKMGSKAYFPGGNDNASGVAMILSLAKALKGNNPYKNYVFIAFAGEEAGLLGSHYYVQHPIFPLKEIDFLLNLDIMGSGEEGITVVNGTVFKKYYDKLCEINNEKKYLPIIKIRGKAANSDHYWFSENDVPAFFFYTMGPNKNYHDILDTYENLSFSAFNKIKQLILDFVHLTKF